MTLLNELQRQIAEEWRLPYALRVRLIDMLDTSMQISIDMETDLRVEQQNTRGFVLKKFEQGVVLNFLPGAHVRVRSHWH